MLELEVAQVAVSVNYQLNAIEVEVANPAGNGAVMLFDLGAALDTCLRIVAACMRLRGLTTP